MPELTGAHAANTLVMEGQVHVSAVLHYQPISSIHIVL